MSVPRSDRSVPPLHDVLSRWDEVVKLWALDAKERCALLGSFAPGPIDRVETYEVPCGEQRMRLLVELEPVLTRIWGNEDRTRSWLRASNPSLADRSPLEVMARSPEWVRWIIDNIGHGLVNADLRPEDVPARTADQPALTRPVDLLEEARLLAYRRVLVTTIRDVSPIVVDIAAMLGVSLDDVAARFCPPPDWSVAAVGSTSSRRGQMGEVPKTGRRNRFLRAAAPVHLLSSAPTSFGSVTGAFMLLSGRIEVMALVGDVQVQTSRDRISILIPSATLADGELMDLAMQPRLMLRLLIDRCCEIEDVREGFVPETTLITLRMPLLSCELGIFLNHDAPKDAIR